MPAASLAPRYTRRRPEQTTLYAVVRDNLETLYGAVDDGALGVALPAFVRAELEGCASDTFTSAHITYASAYLGCP